MDQVLMSGISAEGRSLTGVGQSVSFLVHNWKQIEEPLQFSQIIKISE